MIKFKIHIRLITIVLLTFIIAVGQGCSNSPAGNTPGGLPSETQSSQNNPVHADSTPETISDTASGNTLPPRGEYWPDENWRTSTPEEQGVDSERICKLIKQIKDGKISVDSMIIIRNGYLITESYFSEGAINKQNDLYSCTKSFISALIGIAIGENCISGIDARVLDLFNDAEVENVNAAKKNMKLEHLLTMTAGLDWDEWTASYGSDENPAVELGESSDTVGFVLNRPMIEEPGSRFVYNSGASQLLSSVVAKSTGIETSTYAKKMLFEPIGISNVNWYLTEDINPVAFGGYGLSMTAKDMAKFGYLYLRKGNWNGNQIIPEKWVEESTKKHIDANFGSRLEGGYGYQWWINSFGGYSARGLHGQYIFVIPDFDMVVVFQSHFSQDDSPPLRFMEQVIMPAAKSSEPLPPNKEFSDLLLNESKP